MDDEHAIQNSLNELKKNIQQSCNSAATIEAKTDSEKHKLAKLEAEIDLIQTRIESQQVKPIQTPHRSVDELTRSRTVQNSNFRKSTEMRSNTNQQITIENGEGKPRTPGNNNKSGKILFSSSKIGKNLLSVGNPSSPG